MAFGIGEHKQEGMVHSYPNGQVEIACECWFNSKGQAKPLLIKYQDEEGVIQTIRTIALHHAEEKCYAGISSVEYHCSTIVEGMERVFTLVFYKDWCRWFMKKPG